MPTIIGPSGIQTTSLDLTTPLPVSEGGTGVGNVKPYRMVLGTPIATTSGTAHDFTALPAWIKRITVMLSGNSLNATSSIMVQIGDSGGIENTGYIGSSSFSSTGVATNQLNTGFEIINPSVVATFTVSGSLILTLMGSNKWVCSGVFGQSDAARTEYIGGEKTLSGVLDRVRLTSLNGTDTFDAGSFNILYEGYED